MRVSFITGSLPPEPCGVGDFTANLVEAMRAIPEVSVSLVHGGDWSISGVKTILRRVQDSQPDIIHIQYPTRGFETYLGPHLLSLRIKSVVTLHEASQVHPLRTLSLLAFTVRSHLVFTTEYEQALAARWAPWTRNRSRIIPICSNIQTYQGPALSRTGVCFFGLLRPDRGLEEFLHAAEMLRQAGSSMPIRIIGAEVPGNEQYLAKLNKRFRSVDIEWKKNLPVDQVAKELASASMCYLPFPEGITERRTSVFAAMTNGAAVLSNKGPQTPNRLLEAIHAVQTPSEAVGSIQTLENSREQLVALSAKARAYATRFEITNIANEHLDYYRSILSS